MEELEEDALRCGGAGGQRGPDKYATQVTETPRTESQAEGKPAHSHHTSSTSNLTREISATGIAKAQKVPAPDREVCAGAGGGARGRRSAQAPGSLWEAAPARGTARFLPEARGTAHQRERNPGCVRLGVPSSCL